MQRADRPLPGAQIYAQDLSPGDTAYKIGGCHPYLISSKNRTHQGWRGAIEGISLFSGSRTQFSPDKPCIKANVVFLERHHPHHHQPEQLDLVPEKVNPLDSVKSSIAFEKAIRFTYRSSTGVTVRTVYPHHLSSDSRSFQGWCTLRNAARNFSFRKMSEVFFPGEPTRSTYQLAKLALKDGPMPLSRFANTPLWEHITELESAGLAKLYFNKDEIWVRKVE